MNILILEDDAERIGSFVKKYADHSLTITNNATLAINYLKNDKFDVIFLDHDLGGKQMDWVEENCGMVVAKWISENPIESKIIVHSFNTPRAMTMLSLMPGSIYLPGAHIINE